MFRKFRAILPRDEQFVARFCEHSDQVVAASLAFRDMLSGDGKQEHHYAEICRFEEQADDITKQTLQAIHRSFITPFDRSQIHDLITALDDTVDLMKETGRRIRDVLDARPPLGRAGAEGD